MKANCAFFVILNTLMSTTLTMNLKNDEELPTLCTAIKGIMGLLTPPLNIQFKNDAFGNCIYSSNSTILINSCENTKSWMSQSSVVIVEKEEDISNLTYACMNYNGHHLIVVQNYSPINIQELNKEILLQTFIPYNERRCNDTDLKTINYFDQETQKWGTDQFFPRKFDNFHGCTVKITTHKNVVPYIVREEYVNGQRILKGRVIKLIEALAQSLNFTTELVYQPSIAEWEICFQRVVHNEVDLFIGNLFLDWPRTKYADFTIPIFFETLKFAIPPGRSYTQTENFARAFDSLTWTLIIVVLIVTGLSVIFISFRSKKLRIYAFGAGFGNSFMDFLATIVGMTSSSIPAMNTSRIIIIKFVLFCFVIRTLYQGTLFNFLQSAGKVKPVQSVDEMINKGFTFFMLKIYDNYFDVSQQKYASKRILNISEFDNILDKISDPNFKGTLMHTGSLISYKNSLKERKFQNIFCKQNLMTIPMVGYLRKNFYLTEIFNQKIGLFHTAGLVSVWNRRSKFVTFRGTGEENDRKPISLNNIKGVLIIYLYACVASVLCFAAEIFSNSVSKRIARINK